MNGSWAYCETLIEKKLIQFARCIIVKAHTVGNTHCHHMLQIVFEINLFILSGSTELPGEGLYC